MSHIEKLMSDYIKAYEGCIEIYVHEERSGLTSIKYFKILKINIKELPRGIIPRGKGYFYASGNASPRHGVF